MKVVLLGEQLHRTKELPNRGDSRLAIQSDGALNVSAIRGRTCYSFPKVPDLFLPVCFAEVLEVVHVAACGGILSVLGLPLLCVSDLQQVSVVFHHVITFLETTCGEHGPSLSFYVLNLKTRRSVQSHKLKQQI